MNTVIITEKLNTHDHGHMYHQKVGKIGMEIGMEYSYTNTIIRKLFDRNFTYSRKILAMEPREVYAFVINNADLLRHTVREAMATELEQLTLDINQVSKVSFHIPQSCLFTYDGTAKTQLEMKKNVYRGYLSSAEVRSSSERKFEKFCEKCDAVEWVYKNGDKTETNGERGLKRKISALRSFYAYYYKHEFIQTNPTVLVDVPKTHEKNIIRLDADEVAMLLDHIEHCGDELTGQKRVYYEKTKERDLAIVTLLLGTGIRVSECVGLDVEDVDFKNNGIKVTRKGGNEMVVYFGHEVEKALKKYLEVRKNIVPVAGHEHALFYSTQRKRIGIQAVENLVKKYAGAITTTKKITPHKLRSTYGTTLYQETGDIYLVADVLGHRDVNTTKKHYAAMDDARRRKAATAVHLRED